MNGLSRCTAAALVLLVSITAAGADTGAAPCSRAATAAGWKPPAVASGGAALDFTAFIDALEGRRAVFIGETHDRYAHHLNQLEVICRLHVRGEPLAVAMEFFQQPYQDTLDAYVAGDIVLDALLERSGYFARWGFDFRLYAPILRFARAHRIPLVALNVPSEVVRKVGQGGLEALSAEERRWVPADMGRADEAYRARLRRVFEEHPENEARSFEHFVQAQLVWDEAMAERAVRRLREHPEQRLVVLAGQGHVLPGGIPARVARRIEATLATVVQGEGADLDGADYRLRTAEVELAPPGRLGVMIESTAGGVVIRSVAEGSGAGAAGLVAGDRLLAVAGRSVETFDDVKIALWDKRPGETVRVRAERAGEDRILERRVELR